MDSGGTATARFVAQAPEAASELAGSIQLRSLLGPLAPHLHPGVTDLFVNGDGSVWADAGGGPSSIEGLRIPPEEAREIAVGLIAEGDRHLDEATPCADAALGAGLRVHAVLPPISTGGPVISIRQARPRPWSLDDLQERGFFAVVPLERVRELVASRANLLITGAAGTGKTSFLAALLGSAPVTERIVLVEDVAELRVVHPQLVALQVRQPNLEGAGAIGLDRLVREALRMRPDRLVVGECRGRELRELLSALNTGHDGGAGTLHANSLADVPARLEALGAIAGIEPLSLARQAVSAFDAVLHLGRDGEGRRLIESCGRLRLSRADRLEAAA